MDEKPLISFDYAIKYLLKDKGDYEIVEGFISALLKSQGYKDVKIVALLDTESNKEDKMGKRSLADLVVEDADHHKYIIEIERNIKDTFVHKACFNTSRLIVDSIAQNIEYDHIVKVFHITLLYFPVGKGAIHHGKTIIREMETNEKLNLHMMNPKTDETFDATDIFPEYFFISIPQFDDRLEQEIDDWLFVMKYDDVPSTFHSPYMKKVAERLSVLKMTAEERNKYYSYKKKLCDEKEELRAAEAKGRAEGQAEGEAKGKAEGKTEAIIIMAKRMLELGLSIEEISKVTTLPVSEIKKL
jgi:predicted transposase/invertase (TIGR01784 family)